MKEMNRKNGGFSLVELIIVIAIMAVLTGVLAPQFIRYVESARRGVDIQNANEIRGALQALSADGEVLPTGKFKAEDEPKLGQLIPSGSVPKLKGNLSDDDSFWVRVDSTGIWNVYNDDPDDPDSINLTNYEGAQRYKNAN